MRQVLLWLHHVGIAVTVIVIVVAVAVGPFNHETEFFEYPLHTSRLDGILISWYDLILGMEWHILEMMMMIMMMMMMMFSNRRDGHDKIKTCEQSIMQANNMQKTHSSASSFLREHAI